MHSFKIAQDGYDSLNKITTKTKIRNILNQPLTQF